MKTLLVVEDDDIIAEAIRMTLADEGFKVIVVHDGTAALDWLAEHMPDLIISDIVMPKMNGYQLFQRVSDNPDWLWIPFLFLSSKAESEDIRFGKELGADDYLTKPFEAEDLLSAVYGRLARFEGFRLRQGIDDSGPAGGRYALKNLIIDLTRRQVFSGDEEVLLSATEFDILQRLTLAGGGVVTHEELMVYDKDEVLDKKDASELVRYHIRSIRQKLRNANMGEDVIFSVRGVGYRLVDQPHSVSE